MGPPQPGRPEPNDASQSHTRVTSEQPRAKRDPSSVLDCLWCNGLNLDKGRKKEKNKRTLIRGGHIFPKHANTRLPPLPPREFFFSPNLHEICELELGLRWREKPQGDLVALLVAPLLASLRNGKITGKSEEKNNLRFRKKEQERTNGTCGRGFGTSTRSDRMRPHAPIAKLSWWSC